MSSDFDVRFRPNSFSHNVGITLEQAQEFLDAEGSWEGEDHLFAESIGCNFARPKTELLPVDLSGVNLEYREPPDFSDEFELGVSYHCQYHSRSDEPCWGNLYQVKSHIVCAGHRGIPKPYITPDEFIQIVRQGGNLLPYHVVELR